MAKETKAAGLTAQNPKNPSAAASRLIIADDHEWLRRSMRNILQSEPDLQIIDEAKDGQEAIELTPTAPRPGTHGPADAEGERV